MNPDPGGRRLEAAQAYDEAMARRAQGNSVGAAARFAAALHLAEEVGDVPFQGAVLAEWGHMHQEEYDVHAARRCYEGALDRFMQAGDPLQAGLTLFKLGQIEQLAGALDRSEERYRSALVCLTPLAAPRAEGLTRASLGQLLWEQDRPDEGLLQLVQGLTLLCDAGAPEADHVRDHIRYWSRRIGRVRYLELIRSATSDPHLRTMLE